MIFTAPAFTLTLQPLGKAGRVMFFYFPSSEEYSVRNAPFVDDTCHDIVTKDADMIQTRPFLPWFSSHIFSEGLLDTATSDIGDK